MPTQPQKRPQDLVPSEHSPQVGAGQLSIRKRQKRNPPSPLESLPNEILERIFFLSRSPALPCSSPRMGSRLSHHKTLVKFVVDFLWTAAPLNISKKGFSKDYLRVVNARFFTLVFVKECVASADEDAFGYFFHMPICGSCRFERGDDFQVETDSIPAEFGMRCCSCQTTTGVYEALISPRYRIPPKLLRGPWTLDKVRLIWNLGYFGWQTLLRNDLALETAAKGLEEAISARHYWAVFLLIGCFHVVPSTSLLRKTLLDRNFDKRMALAVLLARHSAGYLSDYTDACYEPWCGPLDLEQASVQDIFLSKWYEYSMDYELMRPASRRRESFDLLEVLQLNLDELGDNIARSQVEADSMPEMAPSAFNTL